MKSKSGFLALLALIMSMAVAAGPVMAQSLSGPPADPQFKYSTPIAPGVATPNRIDSSIGTLNLSDGFPAPDTIEKIDDNLDRSRALQAYRLAIPIVNQAGMRDSPRKFGPDNQTNVIWENLVDSKTVELTANNNTIDSFIWIDTKKGPLVVEVPPWSWEPSMTSGIAGWPTLASRVPTGARATST